MSEKPVIDIVTYDSEQCAICAYMLESVSSLPDGIRQHLEFKEWSIKNQEGINKFMEHNVKVFPTVVINGRPVFESVCPSLDEMLDALEAVAEKEELKAQIGRARVEAEASYMK